MEVIFEVLVNIILVFPGAFFRWLLNGFKNSYSFYLNKDGSINSVFGAFFIIVLGLLYAVFRYYLTPF